MGFAVEQCLGRKQLVAGTYWPRTMILRGGLVGSVNNPPHLHPEIPSIHFCVFEFVPAFARDGARLATSVPQTENIQTHALDTIIAGHNTSRHEASGRARGLQPPLPLLA